MFTSLCLVTHAEGKGTANKLDEACRFYLIENDFAPEGGVPGIVCHSIVIVILAIGIDYDAINVITVELTH